MRPFIHQSAETAREAIAAFGAAHGGDATRSDAVQSPVQYLAGGTTLIDLMKLDVMRPEKLIDINGVYTVLAQTAAERLGVPLSAVQVAMGDSTLPPAPVAGGSNTTASTCSAVIKACEAIRAKLLHAASTANDGPLAGRPPAALRLTDGRAVAADGAQEKLESLIEDLL
jgi:hypothetical protein